MIKNLKKKLKTFYKKNTALSVVILFALIIGLPAVAYNSFDEDVKNLIADKYLELKMGVEEVTLGAITQDKSRFDHGIEILSEGLDITGGDLNVDGTSDFSAAVNISGAVTMSDDITITGTTTPSVNTYSSIDIPLTQSVTTTPNGTIQVMGSYCNSDSPVVIENWYFDIETANSMWGMHAMTVGTTTEAGDDSFTATSTATLIQVEVASSTTGFFDRDGLNSAGPWQVSDAGLNTVTSTSGTYYASSEPAMATTTPFLLDNNVCFVIATDEAGATSSASWTAIGGYTEFAGTFHARARLR